jgi:hypothetical protein
VLAAGDEHRRLLALLDDKPWPSGDDGRWSAAFPWNGEPLDVELAELSVAPGIVVVLPGPEGGRRRSTGDAPPGGVAAVASGPSVLARAAQAERAQHELAEARSACDALEAERDGLVRERDALRRERDRLVRERDAAVVARDAAVRERDGALVVRDRLERERASLVEARDALRRRLEGAS